MSNDNSKNIELRLCINNKKLLNCFDSLNIEKAKELFKACSLNDFIDYDKFVLMLNYYSSFIIADNNKNNIIEEDEFKFIVWLISENEEPTINDIIKFKSQFENKDILLINDYID